MSVSPHLNNKARGRNVTGWKGLGAGDKIVTPWFIVLHQIFVYSPNLIPLSFSFFCGKELLTLLWLPHQPSPYKGWYKLINLIRDCDCGCDYRGWERREGGIGKMWQEGWLMEVGVRWQPWPRRWWAGRCGRGAKMLCMTNEESYSQIHCLFLFSWFFIHTFYLLLFYCSTFLYIKHHCANQMYSRIKNSIAYYW